MLYHSVCVQQKPLLKAIAPAVKVVLTLIVLCLGCHRFLCTIYVLLAMLCYHRQRHSLCTFLCPSCAHFARYRARIASTPLHETTKRSSVVDAVLVKHPLTYKADWPRGISCCAVAVFYKAYKHCYEAFEVSHNP